MQKFQDIKPKNTIKKQKNKINCTFKNFKYMMIKWMINFKCLSKRSQNIQ